MTAAEKRDKIIGLMAPCMVLEIPKCNICGKNPAIVDAPTLTGQWANICKECLCDVADIAVVAHVGTRFQLRVVQEPEIPDSQTYDVIECQSLAEIMAGEDRYVKCPKCGAEHHMELDADGVFKCHVCKRNLRMEAKI